MSKPARSRIHSRFNKLITNCLASLVLAVTMCVTPARLVAGELRFELLDSEQTGLRAVFEEWRREETERQKTETGSHGWWPWGLRAFDYDLDGDLDLIASHHGRPTSIILRNHRDETGQLKFSNATAALGLKPRELPGADDRPWIWDFDGDGYLDIAGISDESKPKSVWNRQGKKFEVTGRSIFSPLSHPREVIDLNGDGYLDVDGGRKGQWFYVPEEKTFRHDKRLRFGMPEGIPEVTSKRVEEYRANAHRFARIEFLTHDVVGYDTRGYAPQPLDLNGDRRPDVVVRGSGGYGAAYRGRYLLRQADGALVDRTEAIGLPEVGAPILMANIAGGRQAEILICGKEHGGLYAADESGRYSRVAGALSTLLTRRDPYLIRAFRADFDNDGDIDLVISQPRLGWETVFENRGDYEFAEILKIRGWDSNPVVIADMDDDGLLDLVVGVKTKDKIGDVAIYMNRTAKTGKVSRVTVRMGKPNPYAVGSVVEAFAPGELHKKDAVPLFCEKVHADGRPLLVGLGELERFDLRVLYADGHKTELRGSQAGTPVIFTSRREPGDGGPEGTP